MAKRSRFPRVKNDAYDCPQDAIDVLLKHIDKNVGWIEPCAGANALANGLEAGGVHIAYRGDIEPRALGIAQADGADIPKKFDSFPTVTNPPFERAIFRHLLVAWLDQDRTCWILQPAGFMHTQWWAKAGFHENAAEIVCLPRLRWIPGSPHKETSDHVWVRYTPQLSRYVIFHPQKTR